MHIELVDNANKIEYHTLFSEMMHNHGKMGRYYTLYQTIDGARIQSLAEESVDLPDKAQNNTRFVMMAGNRALDGSVNDLVQAYSKTLLEMTSFHKDKKAKSVLQIFANEIGLTINSATNNRIYSPCLDILDTLDDEILLEDHVLKLDRFQYAEAQRARYISNRNNTTGYSAFMR